jgi:hypothetical protein
MNGSTALPSIFACSALGYQVGGLSSIGSRPAHGSSRECWGSGAGHRLELRLVACEQRSVVFITSVRDDVEKTLQDDISKRARLGILRIQHCELRRLIVRADGRDERGV